MAPDAENAETPDPVSARVVASEPLAVNSEAPAPVFWMPLAAPTMAVPALVYVVVLGVYAFAPLAVN